MSQKIVNFHSVLGNPMTVHNYAIQCEALGGYQVLVTSTSFPTEKLQDVVLYYLGERIKYPTIPTNSGEWRVTVPESENGLVFWQLAQAKNLIWTQKTGLLHRVQKQQVIVTARSVDDQEIFQVILHGTYIKGNDDVTLDYSQPTTPFTWNCSFSYDWIEDKQGQAWNSLGTQDYEKTPPPITTFVNE